MGDIWFCALIIIFAYFAQFVAHEQTRVTLVPLSGNAFNDNFSAEELKMVPPQSGRKGLTTKGSGPGMNLRGEKRYQTLNCETSGRTTMASHRANSSFDTTVWAFGAAYLTWSNMKSIIGLFLYGYILKFALEILRDCRSIDTNIGNEENLHPLAQLKKSLSHLKTLLTKEDNSLRPKDPHSHKTTDIINCSDFASESSIEISESEESSVLIIPHLSSSQTSSSSLTSTASYVRKSGILASTASFVRKSGGCFGLIYDFNCFPLYIYSSPNLNQNSDDAFGEVFLQRPSMRNSWLIAQSIPSVFYVNQKKRWYSKGTINYVSSTSSKDHCKRWQLAESYEQCHSKSLSSLRNESHYVRSSSIISVADYFTLKLNGETAKENEVVNQRRCRSSVEDFSVPGNGFPADETRYLSSPNIIYPSFDKPLSQDVDEDLNIIDDVRDEGGSGTWQLNDSCDNQQQLNVTENESSFLDMLKDIWTDIKVESHHQIIVPLLLHTAKTCFLEFGVN